MKAIVLTQTGAADKAFTMKEMSAPALKSEDEVLIKVAFSGLNFADIMARKGMYKDAPPLPSVLGYDVSGVVEAAGINVKNVAKGDKVFAFTRFGGYAEYVVCNAMAVAKIPESTDLPTATALATQFSTAYYCAAEMVNLFEGDNVLIHAAAGGVGTALVQYALHKRCRIFGTAGSDEKIKLLLHNGVQVAINYRRQNWPGIVKEKTNGKGVDAIFDAIGGKSVKNGIKNLSPGGRIVCYGAAEMSNSANPIHQLSTGLAFGFYNPGLLIMASKSILGVNMLHVSDQHPHVIQRCMTEVGKLVEAGVFKPVLSKVFPASDMAGAHAFLEGRGSVGKVVVEW